MRLISCLVLLLLVFSNAFAQTSQIDSLKVELEAHPEPDTLRVMILNELGRNHLRRDWERVFAYAREAEKLASQLEYAEGLGKAYAIFSVAKNLLGDQDSSIYYNQKALAVQEVIGNQMEMALIYYRIGKAYRAQNRFAEAEENYLQTLQLSEALDDGRVMSAVLNELGLVAKNTGNYDKAAEYYIKSVNVANRTGNQRQVSFAYNNLGVLYLEKGDYQKALENYQQALEVRLAMKDSLYYASVYLNLGGVYLRMKDYPKALDHAMKALIFQELTGAKAQLPVYQIEVGKTYMEMGELAQAQTYFQKSLKTSQEIKGDSHLANSYYWLGSLALKNQDYPQANTYLSQAVELREKTGESISLPESQVGLAEVLFHQRNYAKAQQMAEIGLKSAKKLEQLPVIEKAEKVLYQLYQNQGNYRKALEAHMNYKSVSDSLLNQSNIREITSLQNQYEFDREKEQIALEQARKEALAQAELSQEKLIRNVSLGGLGLVAILAVIFYRNYEQKRKANLLLAEQKKQIEAKNTENETLLAEVNRRNAENELLLKEIHHRVKNNLQIISSLLNLQTRATEDEAALAAMTEGQNRVKAMALIHQGLYQNEDLASIDFGDYARSLAEQLASIYHDQRKTELRVEAVRQKFDIDTAVPLGLILNELLTNSFKYAFQELDSKRLTIRLSEIEKGRHRLEVLDNGNGLPEGIDLAKAKSTGLRLVRRLTKQLKGDFRYVYENGAHFTIEFKDTELRRQTL